MILSTLFQKREGSAAIRKAAAAAAHRCLLESLESRQLMAGDVKFAVIGDFGRPGQPEADVANLVKGWNPDAVITTGDNNYESGSASSIDPNIGQYYHDFIYPYKGTYGSGSPTGENRFFPSLGNHDIVENNGQPHFDYFTLPGNERYYTFTKGSVQFFALNSNGNEVDGTTSTSAQANWLKNELAKSTAKWQVVYFHHPPYTSNSSHGPNYNMRWDFKSWGADVVLSGHNHSYERVDMDGLAYITNGIGGASLNNTWRTPVAGSQVRYADDYGAQLVEADDTHMTFKLITRGGQLIDSYTVGTPGTVTPAPAAPSALSATANSPSQVALRWTDNSSNETGFAVERMLGTSGTWSQVATVGAGTTSYTDSWLAAGTTYSYRVRAYNTGANSAYSNSATVTTQSGSSTTGKLAGTTFGTAGSWGGSGNTFEKAFDGSLTTYFDGPGGNGNYVGVDLGTAKTVTSVRFAPRSGWTSRMVGGKFQGSNTSSTSGFVDLATIAAAPAAGSLTTLAVSDPTAYRYVRYLAPDNSYGNIAEAEFYGTSSGGVTNPTPTPAAPAAPSALAAAVASSTQVNLTWADNSGDETGFKIERSVGGSAFTQVATVGANVRSYSDTGLTASTAYTYRVRATNAVGDSGYSNTAAATTPAAPVVPPTPTPIDGRVTGTPFGTAGSWNNVGNTYDKALDGSLDTFFDSSQMDYATVGLDLGTAKTISSVRFAPRSTWASRMVGGKFQGSNTSSTSGFVDLATVTAAPTPNALTTLAVSDPTAYRYVRYIAPAGSWGNIAELEFYGSSSGGDGGTVTPPPPTTGSAYLSDLAWASVTNGYGPVEKDMSNGQMAAGDGQALTLGSQTYAKGLGVHANSEVTYNLAGKYTRFFSDIGIDEEVGSRGSVIFQVWADGAKLFDSGLMTGSSLTRAVDLDVTGHQQLKLVVTDGGNGMNYDHADWAGARVS